MNRRLWNKYAEEWTPQADVRPKACSIQIIRLAEGRGHKQLIAYI